MYPYFSVPGVPKDQQLHLFTIQDFPTYKKSVQEIVDGKLRFDGDAKEKVSEALYEERFPILANWEQVRQLHLKGIHDERIVKILTTRANGTPRFAGKK